MCYMCVWMNLGREFGGHTSIIMGGLIASKYTYNVLYMYVYIQLVVFMLLE